MERDTDILYEYKGNSYTGVNQRNTQSQAGHVCTSDCEFPRDGLSFEPCCVGRQREDEGACNFPSSAFQLARLFSAVHAYYATDPAWTGTSLHASRASTVFSVSILCVSSRGYAWERGRDRAFRNHWWTRAYSTRDSKGAFAFRYMCPGCIKNLVVRWFVEPSFYVARIVAYHRQFLSVYCVCYMKRIQIFFIKRKFICHSPKKSQIVLYNIHILHSWEISTSIGVLSRVTVCMVIVKLSGSRTVVAKAQTSLSILATI